MSEVSIIGIDSAKRNFQMHGVQADGSVAFRRMVHRDGVLAHLSSVSPCVVVMEACASAHYWGREVRNLGYEVRPVPPVYVKPFVKRQNNDSANAKAICEATQRPTMRFVAVKSEEQQASGMLYRTRDLLVRQRTQTINVLRGHLVEFGVIAPQAPAQVTHSKCGIRSTGFRRRQRHGCGTLPRSRQCRRGLGRTDSRRRRGRAIGRGSGDRPFVWRWFAGPC